MSRKNSLAAKAARREHNAASKQVNNCNNSKTVKMELPEQVTNPSPQTVGIVLDFIKKSGDSIPFLFQTDRSEFFEVHESIKKMKDVEDQQRLWFAKMIFTLCEIIPIDETFFKSAVFSIASSGEFNEWFEEYPNEPVAFGVMIYEDSMDLRISKITYNVWVEIFEMYQSEKNFKQQLLH